ncbi:hypothetical protein TNCV_3350161 [Trichonephila clavipes]|nr:hypothetical protein TNCV_3350161 [Trichonephila clavipes]
MSTSRAHAGKRILSTSCKSPNSVQCTMDSKVEPRDLSLSRPAPALDINFESKLHKTASTKEAYGYPNLAFTLPGTLGHLGLKHYLQQGWPTRSMCGTQRLTEKSKI